MRLALAAAGGLLPALLSCTSTARADNFALIHVACGQQERTCPTCWSHHTIVFTVGRSNGATVECSFAYKWRVTGREPPVESAWDVRTCDKRLPAMWDAARVSTWRPPNDPPHRCMANDLVQVDRASGRYRVCTSAPNLGCSTGALPE